VSVTAKEILSGLQKRFTRMNTCEHRRYSAFATPNGQNTPNLLGSFDTVEQASQAIIKKVMLIADYDETFEELCKEWDCLIFDGQNQESINLEM
jgi:hypothetical protein